MGKDFLLVEGMRVHEGLNQLFRIELDILHEEKQEGFDPTYVDPVKLLGNPMIVSAHQPPYESPTERYFNGICITFTQGSRNGRFSSYRAELVPKVWMLTQIRRSRIFQNRTVPQILEEVLAGYEFDNEINPQGMEPRNYCVQYRESDWDFLSRLMEEEGIYYYFSHTKEKHKLVLGNTPTSHRPTPTAEKITYALERSDIDHNWIPSIFQWRFDNRMFTGTFELRDFHFQLPTNDLQAVQTSRLSVGKNEQLERYDWPGDYAKRYDGIDPGGGEQAAELNKVFPDRERTVKIRQEELDARYLRVHSLSDCCAITAGYRFTFTDHPIDKNKPFVVVSAHHKAIQSPSYISGEPMGTPYEVEMTCIPHGQGKPVFRPERKTPKPIVHGSQTAKVVGNPGDEIFTDKYGRVKVHFHWDRSDNNDQKASAWIRYGTLFAGNKWGSMFIPRVGQEVIVDFMEGDPDKPIIVGCVYNAENMPHYDLPKYKTLSYIKTHSTPKANGFNEIRFEDKAKKEQVFIHSQKRYDLRARGSMYETCGGNRQEVIGWHVKDGDKEDAGGNLAITVGGNYDFHVVGDQFIGIDKGSYETIKKDVGQEFKAKQSTKVTAARELNARSITLEALSAITLRVGPMSFIKVDLTGVTIQGPIVNINSGGAATPTTPFQMADPLDAEHADTGEPGYLDRPRTGGGGGGRRWRTVDGYHAPVVRRNDDGSYQVQSVVVRGNPAYQQAVLTDIAQISQTTQGQTLLNNLQASGQTTTIQQMNPAPNPPNAFALPGTGTPADFQAATPAGQPVFNGAGNPVNDAAGNQLLGTGTGVPSNVSYNPDQWPSPQAASGAPGDVILFHELQHSNNQQRGQSDMTPRTDGFDTNEEFNAIGPENQYRDERGVPRRTNHHDL